jgi:hypothetical protein
VQVSAAASQMVCVRVISYGMWEPLHNSECAALLLLARCKLKGWLSIKKTLQSLHSMQA